MQPPPHIHADNHSIAAGGNVHLERVENLTAAAVHALGIEPCPRCERHLLSRGLTICRHCAIERVASRMRKLWITLLICISVVMLCVFSAIIHYGRVDDHVTLITASLSSLVMTFSIIAAERIHHRFLAREIG